MSGKKYFVSKDGEQMGPYSIDELRNNLSVGAIHQTDYVYDEDLGDWVFIMQFKGLNVGDELASQDREPPPSAPSVGEFSVSLSASSSPEDVSSEPVAPGGGALAVSSVPGTSVSSEELEVNPMDSDWYVLKGDDKFGPFPFEDVVKMLQEKSIFEFDFVWNPSFLTWKRVAEIDLFSLEHLNQLRETSMPEIQQVFFRRKHPRVNYGRTVLVHDNKRVWKAQGVEVSSKGARVLMDNSILKVGQTLYLHFKAGDGVPPFNAICEIVNKAAETEGNDNIPRFSYGLKFTSIASHANQHTDTEASPQQGAISKVA